MQLFLNLQIKKIDYSWFTLLVSVSNIGIQYFYRFREDGFLGE